MLRVPYLFFVVEDRYIHDFYLKRELNQDPQNHTKKRCKNIARKLKTTSLITTEPSFHSFIHSSYAYGIFTKIQLFCYSQLYGYTYTTTGEKTNKNIHINMFSQYYMHSDIFSVFTP